MGNYSNGSGVGNELDTEKPMVRKFILDSLKYWVEEYHIDGFRFDLMALYDRDTMKIIEETLHGIDDSILMYGEPWTGGLSSLKSSKQMLKGVQQGINIAVFNDNFCNDITGDNNGTSTGFVSGAPFLELNIKRGTVGEIKYNEEIEGFSQSPGETINYVSAHDNLTLWDKLNKSNPSDLEEIKIKMDILAQGIILTSQGIPFIQGGEEMLRTKYGNHNSYNSGIEVNQIKWERKAEYQFVFENYKGLIKLRKNHSAFRMSSTEQIKEHILFFDSPDNVIGFLLHDYANNDKWKNIVVYYNGNREGLELNLPAKGEWKVVVNNSRAGIECLGYEKDTFIIEPISMMVLYQN